MTRTQFFLVTAAWIATVPNAHVAKLFFDSPSAGEGLGALAFTLGGWMFVFTTAFFMLLALGLLFWGRSAKALCVGVVLAGAILSYFSVFLGTRFDKTMLLNILQTDLAETIDLLHWRMLAWFLVIGVLPAVVLARIPLRATAGWFRATARPVLLLSLFIVSTSLLVYAQYSRYAAATRNRHVTFDSVAPANVVAAAITLGVSELATNTTRAPRGTDAHQAYAIQKPRLLVLVLGETARAQNHGLNGYLRETTPRMRAAKGFYFPDTESCGTATAISVPCIFSGFTRHEFSLLRGRQNETLIDVVVRAKARVLWLDNDSGCKGVCDKADFQDFTGSNNPRWCEERAECLDEILLDGLESKIRHETRDTLVVLHLKGSHGPAYYKRYPPAFEKFTPVCKTSDLSSCDVAALRNTYDNTILYTDHVIGETIKVLQKVANQYATSLLYVSDHGESLGESGLFLHGMPYAVAPKEQTHVPMFAWVSPEFLKLERWDRGCMEKQTKVPRSHDNVYATVLGFMEIESVEYKPALDLFDPCDPAPPTPMPSAPPKASPN
ncbi:hypothetical protein BWI17_11265 [Betaproteobacteria bacterium GR16-43]|nr:hypothetical protein BWI17_11265 [Betaproteobacteria bacterium GR16-43]